MKEKSIYLFPELYIFVMKRLKLYEAEDKMIDLISDNYSLLQALNAFGIRLGFGDKTVKEACTEQSVDAHTFLAVVNFIINGYAPKETDDRISVKTLLGYLRASHRYFVGFQLPAIRQKLEDIFNQKDSLAILITHLYDEYAQHIQRHMKYEEKTLFPYVEALLRGEQITKYNVGIFSKHHGNTTDMLQELKRIIIQYLPNDCLSNNKLTATLYDIYNNEEWLLNHSKVEDEIFVPAIRSLENKIKSDGITSKITDMIRSVEGCKAISEREKEIIVCLAQGMSNKEIANHLIISVNTVITHRRNIARKLNIHSVAGLTIYAIANNLIDKKCFSNL